MADSTTANYGLTKPTVNDPTGDSLWGQKLNANFDTIDTNLKRVDSAASAGGGPSSNAVLVSSGNTYTATLSDKGKTIYLLGTGALSLPAATQVAGWYCYVKKQDGVIAKSLVTPTGVAIDGLPSIGVYQESFMIIWSTSFSTFLTLGRQRGWVPMGSLQVAAGSATVPFGVGYDDSEFRDMEFGYTGYGLSTTSIPQFKVSKAGALSATYTGVVNSITSTTPAAIASTAAIPLGPSSAATVNFSGRITHYGFASTAGGNDAWVHLDGFYTSTIVLGRNVESGSPTTPSDGVAFTGSAGTVSSGRITQKGFRA